MVVAAAASSADACGFPSYDYVASFDRARPDFAALKEQTRRDKLSGINQVCR